MEAKEGKVKATEPGEGSSGDTTLPDPTGTAKLVAALLLVLAVVVAFVLHKKSAAVFKPSGVNFSVFAGFYVAAQVIERLLELVSPLLPPWDVATPAGAAKAAQLKADRGVLTLGVAAVLGVIASSAFGLFFLATIGMHTTRTVDIVVTGLTIAGGTKPLHDFIGLIQSQKNPSTGTTA